MIRIILSGGLGNQMFEYAAGRALSIRHKTTLFIDLQVLHKTSKATKRSYELSVFGIANTASSFWGHKIAIRLFGKIKKRPIAFGILGLLNIFRDERAQCYDRKFEVLSDKTTLFGYFQNENYFKDISEQLRTDFQFATPLDDRNSKIRDKMRQTTSVSLHIRRGDYVNLNSNLPILDTAYYEKAIEYMTSRIANPSFFVFSDDMAWVKQNINLSGFDHEFIDWNTGKNSYIDMQLMSLCQHNVIANSSFSWWAAWLNANPNKWVIAPSQWYKNDTGMYPDGFFPEKWIIL